MQATDLGHGRGWLDAAAAASVRRVDHALGHPAQITEAGRTWARQNQHFQAYRRYLAGGPWAPIALDPDAPSIHQLGEAVDSDEWQEHVALLAEHGWVRTVYRGGKLVEPWHFEYFAHRDQHRNDPTPTTTITDEEEEDEMAMKGAHYKRKDGKTVHMLFNEVSGFYVEHSGVPGEYNNEIARNWDTNSWPQITEAHAVVIKRSLDAVRRTALTGTVSVDIDDPA